MGISFPTVAPPQAAPQRRSDLDGLAELLLAVTQQRRQLAMQREELNMRKQEFEQRKLEGGVRMEGAKLENEQKRKEIELAETQQKAREIVTDALPRLLMKESYTDADVSALRVELLQQNKKIAPYVDEAFSLALKNTEQAKAALVERAMRESQGRVQAQTEATQVQRAKTEAQNAIVELDLNRVRKAIADAQLAFDPQRIAIATSVMGNGANAGTAFRLAGVPLPAGIDPNYVLPSELTGKQTDQTRRAEGLLAGFRLARQQATAIGPVPLTFINSVRARTKGDGLIGGTIASFANVISSDNQQKLFNAYNTMSQMWRFHVSGAASALGEASQLMQLIAPLTGDKPETVLQKAQLQNAIEESMSRVVGAEWNPQQAVDHLISVAKANKMDKKTIDMLQKERSTVNSPEAVAKYQARLRAGTVQGDAAVLSRFAPSRP